MSRASELFKAIEKYIIENDVNPTESNTAKYWNQCLGTNYAPATFISAVNNGLMERHQYFDKGTSTYSIIPRGELKEKYDKIKHEEEIKTAKRIVSVYEKRLNSYKEDYDRQVEYAKNTYDMLVESLNERYEEALKTLNSCEE